MCNFQCTPQHLFSRLLISIPIKESIHPSTHSQTGCPLWQMRKMSVTLLPVLFFFFSKKGKCTFRVDQKMSPVSSSAIPVPVPQGPRKEGGIGRNKNELITSHHFPNTVLLLLFIRFVCTLLFRQKMRALLFRRRYIVVAAGRFITTEKEGKGEETVFDTIPPPSG